MYRSNASCSLVLLVGLATTAVTYAQRPDTNYDESKVPKYELPDPLALSSGERVTDAAAWRQKRRPEVLGLFERHVYGKAPCRPENMKFQVKAVAQDALGGKATRKQVTIYVAGDIAVDGGGGINLTMLPRNLTIICSGTKVSWNTQSSFYGSLSAPNADVQIGGQGHFFGAVTAWHLELTGKSQIHVDESWSFQGTGSPTLIQ